MMAGPADLMKQEQYLTDGLKKAAYYTIENGQLKILASDNQVVLIFSSN